MENGRLSITTAELDSIAAVLGCNIEELLQEQSAVSILKQKRSHTITKKNKTTQDEMSFGELLGLVLEHQQRSMAEVKSFIKELQAQLHITLSELRTKTQA